VSDLDSIPPRPKRLRILCHNVFWFQGAPFEPEMPGKPQGRVFEALVELYKGLNADVICLQEIQSETVFGDLKIALGMDGEYCRGGVLKQYGGTMMWKTGCRVTPYDWSNDPPQRMWQQARVPETGVLRVCNVHLPSNRQLGRERSKLRRIEELRSATQVGPQVFLGDFNEPPGGPVSDFMGSLGYMDAAEMTGRSKDPTSLNGNRGDQIWVSRFARDRMVGYGVLSARGLETSVVGKTHLSDHLPLWIEMEIDDQ
jgi:endonuclease/exonuclease/phosphatase family metal-dependent hydrolase